MLSSCMKQIENSPVNGNKIPWYEIPAERWKDTKSNRFWQRDSQRQKLYAAQWIAIVNFPLLGVRRLSSLEAIQRYVDRLTKSAWFKTRFGDRYRIKVAHKKGVSADACWFTQIIRFSKYSRSVFTVLHEVAHIVYKNRAGSAHGRFYARTLIELVEHEFGKEAAKILKQAFRKERVKYLPKRELSEETREKLRQGFINRVLKQKVGV